MVSEVQDPLSANGDDSHQHPLTMQPELTGRSFFIETYGCQMNVSDTEIVHAVLEGAGLVAAASPEEANVVLVNTCAVRSRLSVLHFKFQHPSKVKSPCPQIASNVAHTRPSRLLPVPPGAAQVRENAENKVWERLRALNASVRRRRRAGGATVGLLGCMAERLKVQSGRRLPAFEPPRCCLLPAL